ncbi:hypothetical protein GGC63_002961 [Paenibacillus sp. OAS669]|nr:hypothetical protein [Paenibacillus sp. OAS669]
MALINACKALNDEKDRFRSCMNHTQERAGPLPFLLILKIIP